MYEPKNGVWKIGDVSMSLNHNAWIKMHLTKLRRGILATGASIHSNKIF